MGSRTHGQRGIMINTADKKTVNHKNSQKVSFGSYRGPLQIPTDIGPMSSTLHAINGQFMFWPKNNQLLKWL